MVDNPFCTDALFLVFLWGKAGGVWLPDAAAWVGKNHSSSLFSEGDMARKTIAMCWGRYDRAYD